MHARYTAIRTNLGRFKIPEAIPNPYENEKHQRYRLLDRHGAMLRQKILHEDKADDWLLSQMAEFGIEEVRQVKAESITSFAS